MAVMDMGRRRSVALFRFGVLGALVSARLEHGDRKALFAQAAEREWVTPDGRIERISARTIETWFYLHRAGGLSALAPEVRSDRGASRSMNEVVRDLVVRAKRERPRRSIRRIIRMLERAKIVLPGKLSASSVHRLLSREGISSRPSRCEGDNGEPIGTRVERRSFIAEHVGDLWVGDALHVHRPVALAPGRIGKAYLLSQIDSASRFVAHSYLAANEQDVDQEHGLRQAILKYGVPRVYYVDRGPAYVAGSLTAICAELSCRLLHAGKRDAEAKGVIERWHRTWREEVEDELPRDVPIPIEELAAIHFAWLAREYHLRPHDTTGQPPRERFLAEVSELRAAPPVETLTEIFLHREGRTVRKDGTVRWGGDYLEVRAELVGKKVEVRFDPRDDAVRPKVYRDDVFVCDTVPLDRIANMHRVRRRVAGEPAPCVEPTGINPLAQLVEEHALATRLAHLATDEAKDNEADNHEEDDDDDQ
jgi:transposase InsO family protein